MITPNQIQREGEQIASIALRQADAFVGHHGLTPAQQCELLDVILTVLATQRDGITEHIRDEQLDDDDL